jgi:YidC/Oxa1 family membrane protein insertase
LDSQRIVLFFALSVVLLLIWQAWVDDNGSAREAAPVAEYTAPSDVPMAPQDVPASSDAQSSTPSVGSAPELPPPTPEALARSTRISVTTDVFDAEIDTAGGDLRQVLLSQYPISSKNPEQPFPLMEDRGQRIFIAQSGLLSRDGSAPDHYAQYTAEQTVYKLAPGAAELRVPLVWETPDGLRVTKVYTFRRGSYLVDVEHIVENRSAEAWSGYAYHQLQRTRPTDQEGSWFIYTYTGGVLSTPETRYQKISFDDMDGADLATEAQGGWAAMIQHYFLGAWVPGDERNWVYYTKSPDARPYVLGMRSAEATAVAAGETAVFTNRLYVGPKDQETLAGISETLRLTVDYGMLTILSQPLFWLLRQIEKVVSNWGWSIVILTFLIKLVFYKLSETSYRSMANMRRVTPKITQIRERYGDDRQRMSQAMMELYKKEKINPLGGCLPILVQIPVFIALYWVLLESVELRQAPFILWIQDLSIRDPFYVLPLLMGVSMFVQQHLNPPPPDPVQAKVLKVLPFVFTLFFAFFPAGLVLYWLVNSVLSILQQWYITRKIEKQHDEARAAHHKG